MIYLSYYWKTADEGRENMKDTGSTTEAKQTMLGQAVLESQARMLAVIIYGSYSGYYCVRDVYLCMCAMRTPEKVSSVITYGFLAADIVYVKYTCVRV